jgi:DNA helicase-4
MDWKREIHEKHGTTLLETFSYEFDRKHTWQLSLQKQLNDAGVRANAEAAIEQYDELILEVAQLMANFLTLFRNSDLAMEDLKKRSANSARSIRSFIGIFESVHTAYETKLRSDKTVDFPDMHKMGRQFVASGKYCSPYRHILVDEFQDTSRSAALLIKALLDQVPDSQLFAVGDDWQSIFRFAGSDVSVMTQNFSDLFGTQVRKDLDTVFRYTSSIEKTSSRFILKNPSQLKKSLKVHSTSQGNDISVHYYGSDAAIGDASRALEHALRRIAEHPARKKSAATTVLVLGRYNHNQKILSGISIPHGLAVEFQTVHRSKGLEADFSVVVDLQGGMWGFPSMKEDHPVFDLLNVPNNKPFEFAEERRLFYVALTRARHHVHLLAPKDNVSPFLQELSGAPVVQQVRCPNHSCKGRLVQRDGKYGPFLACNQGDCKIMRNAPCPNLECGGELEIKKGPTDFFQACSNWKRTKCSGRKSFRCPSKGCNGQLMSRKSKYGEFFSCSNKSCTVTANDPCPNLGCDGYIATRRSASGKRLDKCTKPGCDGS